MCACARVCAHKRARVCVYVCVCRYVCVGVCAQCARALRGRGHLSATLGYQRASKKCAPGQFSHKNELLSAGRRVPGDRARPGTPHGLLGQCSSGLPARFAPGKA